MSVKARIRYDVARDDIEFAVVVREHDVYAGVAVSLQHLREGDPAPIIASMAGVSAKDLLQALLDAAWDYGMRPVGYGYLRESTSAVKAHLADMRQIAFHKLGMKEPGQ